MRKLLLFVVFAPIPLAGQSNPCADSLYLALRNVPVDEMTDREFELLMERDKACLESANAVLDGILEKTATYEIGWTDGQKDAGGINIAGSLVGGVAGGFVAGLIGTGIAYAAQDEPKIPPGKLLLLRQEDPSYTLGYEDGYHSHGLRRKRTAAVAGGLAGTAAIVAVILTRY